MFNNVPPPPPAADRTLGQEPSIWVSIGEKVAKYKPLNLGQGFPDFLPKEPILSSLRAVASDGSISTHQEARSQGLPRLVEALAKVYTPLTRHDVAYSGRCPVEIEEKTFSSTREINPETEIIVSIGAYGSLSSAFYAVVNPGDEVLIMEPAFDCYTPMTLAVGGKPVYTALLHPATVGEHSSAEWTVDFDDLESKITVKSRVLVLNTPNNPLGKVFSLEELQRLADICIRHNLICFSDEVYEWIVFPPFKHIKIASLSGMWERTLTIGSAGKTFNVTGWKIGWTIGPENLISAMQKIQKYTIGSAPAPLQEALAVCFEYELPLLNTIDSFFHATRLEVAKKVKILASALSAVGMKPIHPQGGFFLMANIEDVEFPQPQGDIRPRDVAFNEWMMITKGLNAIPPSVFYCSENKSIGEKFLRFCMIKDEKTLGKAIELLKNW